MKGKFGNFIKKFRGETVTVIGTVITFTASVLTILTIFPKSENPLITLTVAFSIVIILLLYILLFNLKRFFRERFQKLDINFEEYKSRLEAVDHILVDFFGFSWRENQYFKRLQHFVDEKKLLAKIFVQQLLPQLIKKVRDDYANLDHINVILDSGTTITPIFPYLIEQGFSNYEGVDILYFTNNLAGIDEIHKMENNSLCVLQERNFNLIGGRPLNKYRATTGDITQSFLKQINNKDQDTKGNIVSIGVITANWIIGGRGLDEIQICARGEGHFEFKVELINVCDHIVVVAPLGKILPLRSMAELNILLDDGEQSYKTFLIPHEKRNKVHLLTTFRGKYTLSPLKSVSDTFRRIQRGNESKNYKVYENIPDFEPSTNRTEAIIVDLAHTYIRDKFEDVYGSPMP